MNLPTQQQCLDYFAEYKVPANIKDHCLAVQKVAVLLAKELHQAGVPLNVELVSVGAVLHDLFKFASLKDITSTKYHQRTFSDAEIAMRNNLRAKFPGKYENEIAFEIFKDQYPELAVVLRNEGDPHLRTRSWEDSVLHYADYRIFHEAVVSFDQHFSYLSEVYKGGNDFWQEYLQYCKDEEKKIFAHLGFTPEQLQQQLQQQKQKIEGDM